MRTSASLAASTMSGQAIMFSGSLWPVECIYHNFMINDSNFQNKKFLLVEIYIVHTFEVLYILMRLVDDFCQLFAFNHFLKHPHFDSISVKLDR